MPNQTLFIVGVIVWVLALAAGILATLMMLVMCMAGGANSSPEQIVLLKRLMLGFGLTGLCSVGGAIALLAFRMPWWGAGAGALPVLVMIVATIIAFTRSG
jgi:hypothetical protein